jgi:hypothetical protein
MHEADTLVQFFGDIHLVKQRLRQPFGQSFSSTPFNRDLPHLKYILERQIKHFTNEDIIEIIVEGNPVVIGYFLGKLFNAFENFVNLTLPATLPNLHLIPIEELDRKCLSEIPLDTLVHIFLARINFSASLKNRWSFFQNIPISFWTHELIRLNSCVMNFFSPLVLPDFSSFELLERDAEFLKDSTVFEIYKEPVASFLDILVTSDISSLFERYVSTDDFSIRSKIANDLKLIIFHLQAIIHVMVMTDNVYLPLYTLVCFTFSSITNWLKSLVLDVNLISVDNSCKTCYSSLIYEQITNSSSLYHNLLKNGFFTERVVLSDFEGLMMLLGLPSGPVDFTELDLAKRNLIFWPLFMLIPHSVTISPEVTRYIEMLSSALQSEYINIHQLSFENGLLRNFRFLLETYPEHIKSIIMPLVSHPYIFSFQDLLLLDSPFNIKFATLAPPFLLNIHQFDHRQVIINSADDFLKLESLVTSPADDILDRYHLPFTAPSSFIPDSVALPAYKYLDLDSIRSNLDSEFSIRIVLKKSIISFDQVFDFPKVLNYALEGYYTMSKRSSRADFPVTSRNVYAARQKFELYPPFQFMIDKFDLDRPSRKPDTTMTLQNLQETLIRPDRIYESVEEPQEITFVEDVLRGLCLMAKNPCSEWQIIFSDSINLSGFGPLVDTLHAFGKVIATPELRTFTYIESHNGFVPSPFLCSRVMAFVGFWIVACWKTNVTLPWQFSEVYLRFLLYDWPNFSDAAVDALIAEIYAPVFEFINRAFELMVNDQSFDAYLPLEFHPHRMFSIPEPHPAGPSPFLLEFHALEKYQELFKTKCQRSKVLKMGPARYSAIVKSKLKDSLLQGRLEFQRHFRFLFNSDFVPYSSFRILSKFFVSESLNAEELTECIKVTDGLVRNDLPSATSEFISTKDLLCVMIRGQSTKELERFLWFVIGSSNPPPGGFKETPIEFRVFEGSLLSISHVCFRYVDWYVNFDSARDTLKKLQISINFSSGFLESD